MIKLAMVAEALKRTENWEKRWLASPENKIKIEKCFEPLEKELVGYHNHTDALKMAMELVAKERLGSTNNFSAEQLSRAITIIFGNAEDDFGTLGWLLETELDVQTAPREEVILLMAEADLVEECLRNSKLISPRPDISIPNPEKSNQLPDIAVVPTKVESAAVDVKKIPEDLRRELIREICLLLVEDPEKSGCGPDLKTAKEVILKQIEEEKIGRDIQKLAIIEYQMTMSGSIPQIDSAIYHGLRIGKMQNSANRQTANASWTQKVREMPSENFYIL